MGFFDEEDLENALDDPFKIVGKDVFVKVDAKLLNSGDKEPVFIVTYKSPAGQSHQEWLRLAKFGKDEADKVRRRSHSKLILTDLGVPVSELNSVEPADLVGREGYLTVYKKGAYYNYGTFRLSDGSEGTGMSLGDPQISTEELAEVSGATSNQDFF